MTLGARIGAARQQVGLSQSQVAERLGVSRQAVSKWETDAACPDMKNLLQLAELFAVPLEELAMDAPSPATPPPVKGGKKRRRVLIALGSCGLLVLLLLALHFAPVSWEAGGSQYDTERSRAYAQKLLRWNEETLMELVAFYTPLEESGTIEVEPDSLHAGWDGRTGSISFVAGSSEGYARYRMAFTGERIWPFIFRWQIYQAVRMTEGKP